jgi:hypothetical protein
LIGELELGGQAFQFFPLTFKVIAQGLLDVIELCNVRDHWFSPLNESR